MKILLDVFENLDLRYIEGRVYKSDIDILRFFIIKPKFGQIVPKFKALSDFLGNMDTNQFYGPEYKVISVFCVFKR